MPTKKKQPLIADEHAELGHTLADITAQLQQCSEQVGNAYPLTGPSAAPHRQLEKALQALSMARSELEEIYVREHPALAESSTYYPRAASRR